MKKIMILAAVALAAVVTNAATVKWSGSGIKGTDGANAGNTYTAYFFIASDSTGTFETMAMDAAIAAVTSKDYAGEGAVASKTLMMGMIPTVTASKTTSVAGIIDTYAIIVNSDASQYLVLDTKTLDCSDPTSTQTASWAGVNNTAADWQAVPEPTSGLLLLLGVAGLALRRKQR